MKYKLKKVKNYDKEKRNLAYIAGISSLGMAYKMSLADIDLADALFVEKEAIKMKPNYITYFEQFNSSMIMNISISAMNILKNLEKFRPGVIKYTL